MMVFVDCVLSDRGHCLGDVPIRTRGLLSGLPGTLEGTASYNPGLEAMQSPEVLPRL